MTTAPLLNLFKLLENDRRVEDPIYLGCVVLYWQHGYKYSVSMEDGTLQVRQHDDPYILHATTEPADMHAFIVI